MIICQNALLVLAIALRASAAPLEVNVRTPAEQEQYRWLGEALQQRLKVPPIDVELERCVCHMTVVYVGDSQYMVEALFNARGFLSESKQQWSFELEEKSTVESVAGRLRQWVEREAERFNEHVKRELEAGFFFYAEIDPCEDLTRESRLRFWYPFVWGLEPAPAAWKNLYRSDKGRETPLVLRVRNQESAKRQYILAAKSHLEGATGETERRNVECFERYISIDNVQAIAFYVDGMNRIGELQSLMYDVRYDTEDPVQCLLIAYYLKLRNKVDGAKEYFERALQWEHRTGGQIGKRARIDFEKVAGLRLQLPADH